MMKKKWFAVLIGIAMMLCLTSTLAQEIPGALALARAQVPTDAELTSTGEDTWQLEVTFKDGEQNQYRVVVNKQPLYIVRVNMKSADESGAAQAALDEAAVRGKISNRFPGADIKGIYLEKKGEKEVFFQVVLVREGFLYKVRLNADSGNITHFVLRGAPASGQFQQELLSQQQAMEAALKYAGGGFVTDAQFGCFGQVYFYQVEVYQEASGMLMMINAVDGSLLRKKAYAPGLRVYQQPDMVAGTPVSQDDDWLFEKDIPVQPGHDNDAAHDEWENWIADGWDDYNDIETDKPASSPEPATTVRPTSAPSSDDDDDDEAAVTAEPTSAPSSDDDDDDDEAAVTAAPTSIPSADDDDDDSDD
jgi:uncharacterized membrane protein YkoI